MVQWLQISTKHSKRTEFGDHCFRSLFRFSSVCLPGRCVFDVHKTASIHTSVFLPVVLRDPVFLKMCPNGTVFGDQLIRLPLHKIHSPYLFVGSHIYIYTYAYIRRHPLGGHQAARGMLATTVPSPSSPFNHQLTVRFSSPFQSCSL